LRFSTCSGKTVKSRPVGSAVLPSAHMRHMRHRRTPGTCGTQALTCTPYAMLVC
jgi:hypothetical protein